MTARALTLLPPVEEPRCLLCGALDDEEICQSPAQMAQTQEPYRFVRCRSCAFVRLSPRVRAEVVGRFYDDTYLPHRGASAWGRHAPTVEASQARQDRARVRRVARTVALTASSRLLDVGCGKPSFLRAFRDQTGAGAVGLDFEGAAWKAEPARWAGLELHEGTLADVKLAGGFDAVTMWHALEHEYDPLDTLRRLRKLTKPGGALVVEVPNHDSLTRRLHGPFWAGYHTPRHTSAYTPATLQRMLETAGWRVDRIDAWGTLDPYVLWWLGRQERLGRSVRGPLEARFVPFVAGKILTFPIVALQRLLSLGVMTGVARAV